MKKLVPIILIVLILAALTIASCTDISARASGTETSSDTSSSASVYYIDSESDFMLNISRAANAGATVVLRTDIYLDRYYAAGGSEFSLSVLNGTLDGRGHAIVGYKNSSRTAYFIETISSTGVLKDLRLVDANLGAANAVYAAPVYRNDGTISDFDVDVTISAEYGAGLAYINAGNITGPAVAADFSGTTTAALLIGDNSAEGASVTDCFAFDTAGKVTETVLLPEDFTITMTEPENAGDIFELKYFISRGTEYALDSFINLYNSPYFNGKTLVSGNYGYYNANALENASGVDYPSERTAGDDALEADNELAGSGAESDPYVIKTAAELISAANAGAGVYMLGADIDLIAYAAAESILGNFGGVLYGNGHAVTGLKVPFAAKVSGEISDIWLGFEGVASAALQGIAGRAEDINFFGSGSSAMELGGGVAESISVFEGFSSAFDADSSGTADRVRSYAENFVAGTGNTALSILNSYQSRGSWNAENVSDSISGAVEASAENIVTYISPVSTGGVKSSTGWRWGETGFGVAAETNVLIPVFPSDRYTYKLYPVLSASDKGHTYGAGSGTETRYFSSESDVVSRESVYGIIDDYADIGDASSLTWYTSVGTPVAGNEFTANSADFDSVYTLVHYDGSGNYYLNVTLSGRQSSSSDGASGSEWTLVGVMVEYLYASDKLARAAGAGDIAISLSELGLAADKTNPFGYAGVTMTVTDSFGATYENGIKDPGTYILTIFVPETEGTTETQFSFTYTINEGNIADEVANYTLSSSVTVSGAEYDGMTADGAPTYTGGAFEPAFVLNGFPYPAAVTDITYTISSYTTCAGILKNATSISNAGTYSLDITVTVDGYAPVTIPNINYYVKRVNATVSPGTINNVYYGAEHPNVNLNPDFTYETTYSQFSPPGIYTVTPVQSVNNDNYHYDVQSSSFEVLPRVLSQSDISGAFKAENTVYDGLSHTVSFDPAAVGILSDDPVSYTFAVEYYFDGGWHSSPPEYTTAGSYSVTARIASVSPANYTSTAEIPLNVAIARFRVGIRAESFGVPYGAAVPEYEVTIYAYGGGGLPNVDVAAEIVRGTHYRVDSDYSPTSDPNGTHTIVVSLTDVEPDNFEIAATANGTLTVGKRTRGISARYEYVYTGSPVAIEFTGDLEETEGLTELLFGTRTGSSGMMLDEAPTDVSADGEVYVVFVDIAESVHYAAFEGEFEFIITPYAASPEVHVYRPSSTGETSIGLIGENNSFVFDGTTYRIAAYYAFGEYDVSFSYIIGGETHTGSDIRVSEPVRISDITLTMTPRSANFAPVTLGCGSFTISRKTLSVNFGVPLALTYERRVFTADELISVMESAGILNTAEYVAGFEPEFTLTVADGRSVYLPGTYELVIAGDSRYELAASGVVTLTVSAADITIDFSELKYEIVYGSVYMAAGGANAYFTTAITYTLGAEEYTDNVTVRINHNTGRSPEPGYYDIVSADPLYESGTETVVFSVINGTDKLEIVKRGITLLWDKYIAAFELVYNGEAVDFSGMSQSNDYISNSAANLPTLDFEFVSGDGISAGSHTVRASLAAGNSASRYYIAADENYTFVISPGVVVYSVSHVTIYSDELPPENFEVTYSAPPVDGDIGLLGETFALDRAFEPYIGGVYSVIMSYEGEKGKNYVLQKTGSDELEVMLRTFDPAVSVGDAYSVYTGRAVPIPVTGASALPAGAEILRSATPVDAGHYAITVAISAPGYVTAEFTAHLTIAPAAPDIRTNDFGIPYSTGYVLRAEDIAATAYFGSDPVEGEFIPESDFVVTYGRNEASVTFEPVSDNFESLSFVYAFETYADLNAIRVYTLKFTGELMYTDVTGASEIVSDTGSAGINIVLPEAWGDEAVITISGERAATTLYSFTSDSEAETIEVSLGGETIFSMTFSVDVNESAGSGTTDPGTDLGGGTGDTGNSGEAAPSDGGINVTMSDETKQALIIAGSSVGGAAVIAGVTVLIVFLVKKKKRK